MEKTHLFKGAEVDGSWSNWCGKQPSGVKQADGTYLYEPWVIQPQLTTCIECSLAWTKAMPPPLRKSSHSEKARFLVREVLMLAISKLERLRNEC